MIFRIFSDRRKTTEERATTLPTAWNQPSTRCLALVVLNVSYTIATRTLKAITPPTPAPQQTATHHVEASVDHRISSSSKAVAVSRRHPNAGSDWRSSHWWYRVFGATYLCAPATDAELSADAVVNLTRQPNTSTYNDDGDGFQKRFSPSHTHKLTEKSNPLPSPLVWRGSCVIIVFVFSLFFSASNTRAKEEDKTSSCSFFFLHFWIL